MERTVRHHRSESGTSRTPPIRPTYEIVTREGTTDDVRRFIDVGELIARWDQLYLPEKLRRTWAAWLNQPRNLFLAC